MLRAFGWIRISLITMIAQKNHHCSLFPLLVVTICRWPKTTFKPGEINHCFYIFQISADSHTLMTPAESTIAGTLLPSWRLRFETSMNIANRTWCEGEPWQSPSEWYVNDITCTVLICFEFGDQPRFCTSFHTRSSGGRSSYSSQFMKSVD